MTWISIAQVKTFTLQVFREYPLSPQGWTCPQEYWTVSVCQQCLLHFREVGKSFCLKPCWKEQASLARLACLYVLVCVCVAVLQNENFEGEHRSRPWVNRNSFSHETNFVFSLGLLGNDMNLNCSSEDFHSAGLQRISFITSRVNMSPRVLNSICVPAVSSSFQGNGQEFLPEALLKKQASLARLACLYVLVCVCRCTSERELRRRT